MNIEPPDDYTAGIVKGIFIEAAELNLISVLKPALAIDGDQYCYLHGDNLQDGIAGFGKSPYLAALEFSKNYYTEI